MSHTAIWIVLQGIWASLILRNSFFWDLCHELYFQVRFKYFEKGIKSSASPQDAEKTDSFTVRYRFLKHLKLGIFILLFIVGMVLLFLLMATPANAVNFTLDKTGETIQVNTGGFGFIRLKFENPLNETTSLNVTLDGEGAKFLFPSGNATQLPANSTFEYFIPYFVPVSNVILKDYFAVVNFSGVEKSYYNFQEFSEINITDNTTVNHSTYLNSSTSVAWQFINISFNVVDKLPPEIASCEINPMEQNATLQLDMVCTGVTDNINITSVLLKVSGEDIGIKEIEMKKDIFSTYKASFAVPNVGLYNATVTAVDYSRNTKNFTIMNISITPFFPLKVARNINFGKIKVDVTHERQLFNLTNPANISVTLNALQYRAEREANASLNITIPPLKLELVPKDGDIVEISQNQTVSAIASSGVSTIRITGNYFDKFFGSMTVNAFNRSFTVPLDGEVVFYYILPRTEFEWFGRNVTCEGIDRDTYENSTIDCYISYSIDTDVQNALVPAPKKLFEDHLQLKEDYQNERSLRTLLGWIFIPLTIILFISLVGYYIWENW